jgi:hypothetical protein
VAGRPQAVRRGQAVAALAQLGLGPGAVRLDDLRAQGLAAEARVLVRLGAAQAMVDMDRRDGVTERAEGVPQAGRVGAARDEAGRRAAARDQVECANVRLDPLPQRRRVHPGIVPSHR